MSCSLAAGHVARPHLCFVAVPLVLQHLLLISLTVCAVAQAPAAPAVAATAPVIKNTATGLTVFSDCMRVYSLQQQQASQNTNLDIVYRDSVQATDGSTNNYKQLQERNMQVRGLNRAPAAFIEATSTADVAAAVRCSNAAGLKFVARSGGHSYEANSLLDGGIVIDLAGLQDFNIDGSSGTLTLGAGQKLGSVYTQLSSQGYAFPGGTCSGVGVSGQTLGGGIGHSMRALGLLADSVLGATVVLADGTVVQANSASNPDLFWAIRGGGPLYGIVTSWIFQLHKAPSLVSVVHYKHSEGCTEPAFAAVMAAFNAWQPWLLSDNHAMVEIQCGYGSLSAQFWYWGPMVAASQTFKASPVFNLPGMKAEVHREFTWPGFVSHMLNDQGRSSFVAASLLPMQPLTSAAIATLAGWIAKAQSHAFIQSRAFGGAFASSGGGFNAFPWRAALFEAQVYSNSGDVQKDKQWVEGVLSSMQPFVGSAEYYNYYHCVQDPWNSYFGPNAGRLQSIKARYDPTGRILGLQCQPDISA